jgi:hypothetical protein
VDRLLHRFAAEPVEMLAHPDTVRMRRADKDRAGRILDGRTWDEFPARQLIADVHG